MNTIQYTFIQIVKVKTGICYLKTPKQQVRSRKDHYQADGLNYFYKQHWDRYEFFKLSMRLLNLKQVISMFFQHRTTTSHGLAIFRSADPEDLRVSLSFNSDVITEGALKKQQEDQENNV